MDFTELETLTQGSLSIMNPISEEKIIRAGIFAGLFPRKRVLAIGCGNGTTLSLWHKSFGITGTAIEIRCVDTGMLVPKEP